MMHVPIIVPSLPPGISCYFQQRRFIILFSFFFFPEVMQHLNCIIYIMRLRHQLSLAAVCPFSGWMRQMCNNASCESGSNVSVVTFQRAR